MKVMIICSNSFYDKVGDIKKTLEEKNHIVITPNGYDEPEDYDDYSKMTEDEYYEFFKRMYFESREKIEKVDAVLALNYTKQKNGESLKNYIGAATFLELYEAFMQGKKIYVLNELPNNMLNEELKGFNPIIINGNFDLIR